VIPRLCTRIMALKIGSSGTRNSSWEGTLNSGSKHNLTRLNEILNIFTLRRTIIILLACLGVTMNHSQGVTNGITALQAAAPGDLAVGHRCQESGQCAPCRNPEDKPHCTEDKEGKKICKCKAHRLYVGQHCFGAEECKFCKKKDEFRNCLGEPKVCTCDRTLSKLGEGCDSYAECEPCKDKEDFTRCSGNPPECKCRSYRFKVGEGCHESEECAKCVNPEDKPKCTEDKEGKRVCKCKEHRLYEGQECVGWEECKICKKESDYRRCSNDHLVPGSPKVCKCRPYASILGERCHNNEQCEKCKDEEDAAVCERKGDSGFKVCQCKRFSEDN